jgi:hypothetical protein
MMGEMEQFLEKTIPEPNSGCLLWTAGADRQGYGLFHCYNDGKRGLKRAHRMAWELVNGPISPGQVVLHRCDTPSCVNVDHLSIGTVSDNNADMLRKGRGRAHSGESHYKTRISSVDVASIRRRCAAGESQSSVGRSYGLSQPTISGIVNRRNWKGVN